MNSEMKSNDEWYTQSYSVKPILKFLKTNSTILCPFDTKESEFVKVLEKEGHKVFYSHILFGDKIKDFFDYTKDELNTLKIDYIISNPPFSIRKQIFIKLQELEVNYAMLVPLVSIALKPIRESLSTNEILVFDKRMKFINMEGMVCKNPPSEIAYICKGVLPQQILFEPLEK